MSLVLSLRKGHDFYVGNTRIFVSWISSSTRFCLKLPDGRSVVVQDDKWYPLLDRVFVMAGTPKSTDQMSIVNIVIQAPRDVVILRGNLYRGSRKVKVCDTCKGSGSLKTLVLCDACTGHGCPACKSGFVVETFKCPDCEV